MSYFFLITIYRIVCFALLKSNQTAKINDKQVHLQAAIQLGDLIKDFIILLLFGEVILQSDVNTTSRSLCGSSITQGLLQVNDEHQYSPWSSQKCKECFPSHRGEEYEK